MYHAIHCGRLAVHQKTAYVFGVISEEIKKELAVKDLFPEEKEGEVIFVEETRFVTMLDTLIAKNGEYNATLVKLISDELGLAKEWTSTKIKNHVEQNKENTYSEFINQIRIHPTDYIHTNIFIGEGGMRIEMREELIKQINLEQSQIPTSYYLLETKKIIILEQLEHAITKLKQAQLEIREAVQETLKMKEDSDDIADQVIATVAELVMAK